MKLAAVTMVYNEREYLPIWCRYYGRAFGHNNCFIIDHGSDDGTLEAYRDFNILRLPRSVHDDEKRAGFISGIVSNLLKYYDRVVYSDVDEIIIPDPLIFPSFEEYCKKMDGPAVSAFGFEVQHLVGQEEDIDLNRNVTDQRRWMWFSSAMCKTVITSSAISWTPGFHSSRFDTKFQDLFLFHLRNFDLRVSLERLQRTRNISWASDKLGRHQRVTDDELTTFMKRLAGLPKAGHTDMLSDAEPLSTWISHLLASERPFHEGWQRLDLHINSNILYQIPERFWGLF